MGKNQIVNMIVRIAAILVILPASSLVFSAHAQEAPARTFPRVELPFGFSYLNARLGSQSSLFAPYGQGYAGVHVALKVNLSKSIGVLADVVSAFGATRLVPPSNTDFTLYRAQVLFGPEVAFRRHSLNTFAHALIGFTSTDLSLSQNNCVVFYYSGCININPDGTLTTTSAFINLTTRRNLALGFGGGLDINWKRHWALRLLQADYTPTRVGSNWENGFHLSTGLVLKF